jgi:hypothetical protein
MKKEKRVTVSLPQPIHEMIWKTSGKLKVNYVAESLLIEYMVDPYLQKRVKNRIKDGFKRNK